MKKYRVSKELKKYVRRVLIRSFYKYHFITDDEGQCWCVTNATSDAFHQIVQRAKCENSLTSDPDCPFVLFIGHKKLIKRKPFEDFINNEFTQSL